MTFNYGMFETVIRDALAGRLSCDMPVHEFTAILATHLNIVFVDEEDHHRFERLTYWLRQPELNGAKVVCANVELVRFGAIAPGADQKKGKKSSAHAPMTFCDPKDLKRMFKRVGNIEYDSVPRHVATVEARAQVVDEWVRSSRTGEDPALPAPELIVADEQERDGNSKRSDMCYIDVDTLLTLIARSRNTKTLNEFCMHHAAATKRYLIISSEMKSNVIRTKDDQIELMRREAAERDAAAVAERKEAARLAALRDAEQQAKIDALLGFAKDTKDSLDETKVSLDEANESLEEVKEQNDGLHTKVDDLQETADDLLKGQTRLYQETVKIQRRVPVKVSNPDREPCIAITHTMYDHKTNGPTIRLFVRWGMRGPLRKNLIELMSGNYRPNRNLIVQARHQLTIAPVYAPDQRNWIDQAANVYKTLISKKTCHDRMERSSKLRNLGSAIKRITSDLEITDANMKKQNISILTHRITRDRAFMRSAQNDTDRVMYAARVAKLEKDLRALQAKLARLEKEREDLKASPIVVPVKFESMHIDYQTNKYIKMCEIVRIFEELIIGVHGAVYLNTMRTELLEEAAKCQQEFISDWYASNTKAATDLRADMKEAVDASGERISRKVAESALAIE